MCVVRNSPNEKIEIISHDAPADDDEARACSFEIFLSTWAMFDGNLNRTEMIKKVIDELWNRGVDSYHKLNSFFMSCLSS